MMATGSGSHHFGRDEDDSGEQDLEDFSLKVWVFE
jgi:hypothetical protein